MSFAAETPAQSPAPGAPRRDAAYTARFKYTGALVAAVLLIGAAIAIPFFNVGRFAAASSPAATPVRNGSIIIDSRPAGAEIVIDGVAYGQTPAKVALPSGSHTLELKADGVTRSLALEVEAGGSASHYVELAAPIAVAQASSSGRLEVSSDPAGAQVSLNGQVRGRTPLMIPSVPPGEHTLVIASGSNSVTRRVRVTAGNTATVVASVVAAGAAGGWLTVKAPIELDIYEGAELIGTTAAERVMLPAGKHDLELVNRALDYRRRVTVQVSPGATVTTPVEVPNGSLSINALPWADVWIDGRPFGPTPLGNLSLPIGSHEVVLRHPQLGERRRTVAVHASTPVRVGVDFNQ
jgi:hypothetical protein